MFIFTWIDSNYIKNNLPVKGSENACTIYNMLHDKTKIHNLKCFDENVKCYVVFINNRIVKV